MVSPVNFQCKPNVNGYVKLHLWEAGMNLALPLTLSSFEIILVSWPISNND